MLTTNMADDKQLFKPSCLTSISVGILSLFYAITIIVFSIFHTLTWSQIDIADYRTIAWLMPVILTFNCFFILLSGVSFAITPPSSKLLLISTGYTFILVGLKNINFHGLAGLFIWEATSTIFFSLWFLKLLQFTFKKNMDYIVFALFTVSIFSKNSISNLLQHRYSYLYSPHLTNPGLLHSVIIKLLAVLILVFLTFMFIRKTKLTYIRLFISLVVASVMVYATVQYNFNNNQLQLITTLPLGFLIGDYFSKYHAFGVVTWLPIFLMGYLLSKFYLLKLELLSQFKMLLFFLISIVTLIIHYWNYKYFMNPEHIINNKIDTKILSVAYAILQDKGNTFISFFAAIFISFTSIFYFFKKNLSYLIEKSINLPQSLLHIYIFTTAFGYGIYTFFSSLNQDYRIIVTILTLLFFYFLIIRFDFWLFRKKIKVNLRSQWNP